MRLSQPFSFHYCYNNETSTFLFSDHVVLNLTTWLNENNRVTYRELQSILQAESHVNPELTTKKRKYSELTESNANKIISKLSD